jgi:pimeloyl-ACP methyl ester carboxylesterase
MGLSIEMRLYNFLKMKRYISTALLIIVYSISIYGQNSKYAKKVQIERYLGTAINNGKGYESGGTDVDFTNLQEGEQLEFKVKSGICNSITLVAKSKYGGWATIYQGAPKILTYEQYFKRHLKNTQVSGFRISVNGSHGQYDRQKCVIDIYTVQWEEPEREHYKVQTEQDSLIEGGRKNSESHYRGIVLDGVSTLDIDFQLPNNPSIIIYPPAIGKLEAKGTASLTIDNENPTKGNKILKLNKRGKGTITYIPPDYIEPHIWYKLASPKDFSFQDFNPGIYTDSRSFNLYIYYKYVDHLANVVVDSIPIEIFKPTLMFVHGFLGEGTTWSNMAGRFELLQYTTYRAEYYAGKDESIEDQSLKLASDIQKELLHLKKSGIKALKVDLICHSMGGLIARNYLYNKELYTQPFVRKLITVGTPHHGVNDFGYYMGKMGSLWLSKHKKAIEQLHEDSNFLRELNAKPASGNKGLEFEFGNIYVVPWDGITYASSAYLNGIVSYKLQDIWHSESIRENSITNSREVRNVIFEWLEAPIKKLPLQNIHMEISSGDRQSIETSYIEPITEDTIISFVGKFPAELRTTESVRAFRGNCVIKIKKGTEVWGMIYMKKGASLRIGYCSPEYMSIHMIKGRAQFNSFGKGGHFLVYMSASRNNKGQAGGSVYNLDLTPTLIGKDTEFIVEIENDNINSFSLDGNVILIDGISKAGQEKVFSTGQGITLSKNETKVLSSLPEEKWWIELVDDENNNEAGIIDAESINKKGDDLLLGYIILSLIAALSILIIIVVIRKIQKLIKKN